MARIKQQNIQGQDHDTLIELKAIFTSFLESYKKDIEELKLSVSSKISDHEARLKIIEKDHERMGGTGNVYSLVQKHEQWIHDFTIKWKTVLVIASTTGAIVGFFIETFAKITGLLR